MSPGVVQVLLDAGPAGAVLVGFTVLILRGDLVPGWMHRAVVKERDLLRAKADADADVDGARDVRDGALGGGAGRQARVIVAQENGELVAAEAGTVATKEGVTHYAAGDFIVSNQPDGEDSYAITRARFEDLYEPATDD